MLEVELGERAAVAIGEGAPCGEAPVEMRELRDAERGGDLGHAMVACGLREAPGSDLPMVAQTPEPRSERVIVGQAHPALAGDEHLARMKAQARDRTERTAGRAGDARADRARRVLDDRQTRERSRDRRLPRREAELVDRDRRDRSRRARRGERFRSRVPLVGADVDEHGSRTAQRDRVRWARPREIRDQHVVSRADVQGDERELEGRRSVRDRDRVRPAAPLSDHLFEPRDPLALDEHPAREDLLDRASLLLAERGPAQSDHRPRG